MLTNRKYTLLAVLLTFVCYLGTTGQDVGCGDQWFDSGGESGVYANNELTTTTFCPDVEGEIVTLTFNYVDIESTGGIGVQDGCWDFIEIFDGPDANSPSLGVFCGEESGDGGTPSNPDALLSIGDAFSATNADGCLTVVFDSDGSVQETGWEALVSCGPPPDCVSPEISVSTERSCDDFNFDAVVTIDVASPSAAPLLIITATLDGVQLGGATVPNLAGQTVDLIDLPLDSDVQISVDVLGASCTVTEIVEISSIGCPVPLTCGEGLEVDYCYDDNDEALFVYESPAGEPVIFFMQSGLIESCCDDIFIYDGLDNTGELLFGGNNGGDLSGVSVTANSGALYMEFDTDGSVSCAGGSTTYADGWSWIVGCGEFDIPGCIDPEALNFSPEATVDDGSCIFPAENDEACGAIALECNGASLTGNFDAASISDELTNCGSTFSPPTGDLWFQFTADGTSTYLISAENGPDMVVALYSGDDCGNLTEVEGCSDFPESFTGVYEAGTYYFLVRPWSSSTFNNSYEVSLTCVDGAPENDEPCGATPLVCNAEAVNGTFLGATSSFDDECSGSGTADVWYTFESDGSTAYGISETSFSDVVVQLFTADACDGELVEVEACDDFPENFSGVYDAGTYYFRIRPWSTVQTFAVQLTCTTPPENNLICDAEPIICGADAEGTTLGATFDDVGTCGTSNTAPGVWYEFTPTIDAVASFSTCNQADFDTKISVFTAADCESSLVCIDGLDDTFPDCSGNSTLLDDIDVFAGQTYFVLVHGFGSAQGSFTLSVACEEIVLDCPGLGDIGDACDDGDPATINDVVTEDCECLGTPPPPGQVCGVPIDVTALPYQDIDNTANFGDDYETTDLPPLSPDAISNGYSTLYLGGDEVVYAYTPTEDQFIDVTLSNHDSWAGLFVIEGCPFESTVGSHTASDNLGREIEGLPVTAGVTYYVVVSTWPTPQSTAYQLNINIAGFDCPDLEGDFGDSCDDGDPLTTGDVITQECECVGTPAPDNDLICNAEPISCDADAVGTTIAASFDDVGTCGTSNTAPGVWYEFTPENDAVASFSTCNQADFDTKISVFTAASCEDDLICVDGLDDTFPTCAGNSTLLSEVDVVAGQTYFVLVHGFGSAVGNFTLSVACEVEIFCPELGANVGDACDDGDDNTINDLITPDCECAGTPTPASQCGDYTSAPDLDFGSNQAIITDEIEVSGTNGTLTDLNVVLVIDHVWTADVEARLTSPSGAQVDLVIGECGSGDNISVLMDDDGPALTCETGSVPVLFGTFAPEGSLADFNGEVFNGTWTLEVEDNFASFDDGTLVSWCLIPTLESTTNPECESAMAITATPEFAGSETAVSMAGAVASGDAQCINGANPQSDMWFSFESVTTNMYVRAWGLNDFDAAVEVYDSCGGELLNCQNDEPAGEREVVIVTNTTVGETYYFRVYHAGDAAPVEQDYTVAVAHIPFTQLSADDCGVLDYTPADMITTDLPVNQFLLTNWYFEFTELEAPFNTYEILSPNGANPNFMLQWFPQAEYGRTYEVRTRARMYQGPQWGDYGDACTIGFSSVPLTTQLIEEQALGFYDMCDVLEADNVPGAEGYRWKFYNGIDDPLIYDSPTRFCQLDLVPGLELGSPYAVIIRVLTQGELSANGEIRLIAMNSFVPDTELDGNITECGSTIPLNTVVSAVNICAAEFYTFKFTNLSDANQADIFYTRDDGLRSINLTSVTGLIAGDTYSVQVLGGSGGLVGEYGDACEITIAGGESIGEFNTGGSAEQLSDVAIELYPNPTSGEEVMMNLSNLSQEQQEVMVEVYDLYGKKVHAEILGNNGSQMNAVIRLPELASGIYTVNVVVNEERIGAKKLVVR